MDDRSGEMPGVETFVFEDDGSIPNNRLCLVLYRGAVAGQDEPEAILRLFAGNRWDNGWVNGIYPFHHYHSNTHEVLGCFRGWADVQFGGEAGAVVRFEAGDAVVIPAGVGHCNRAEGGGFGVVGAYPRGAPSWDLCRGLAGERPAADEAIAAVAPADSDPLFGRDGPLVRLWRDGGFAGGGAIG